MAINVNWKQLRHVFNSDIPQSESIVVHYLPKGASGAIKKRIPGNEFLNFVWTLSDRKAPDIAKLIVTDVKGKVLYDHPEINSSNEVIPNTGNHLIIPAWNKLDEHNKSFYIKILLAQIDHETKYAKEFRSE
jgi:hypothetical protein